MTFWPSWLTRQTPSTTSNVSNVYGAAPSPSEAIVLLSELADVIESVRGDRDLLRVSGKLGDRTDIGVIGIDRFVAMVRIIVAHPQS